jgi:hypothetical protein
MKYLYGTVHPNKRLYEDVEMLELQEKSKKDMGMLSTECTGVEKK